VVEEQVDLLRGVQVAVDVGRVGQVGPDDLVEPLAVDVLPLERAGDVRLLDRLPAVPEVDDRAEPLGRRAAGPAILGS
jgi:hypothetical protein